MKEFFKYPMVDLYPEKKSWWKWLWSKFYNWRMDRMFTCRIRGCDGELRNLHGYFECMKCKHEYKQTNNTIKKGVKEMLWLKIITTVIFSILTFRYYNMSEAMNFRYQEIPSAFVMVFEILSCLLLLFLIWL